MGFLDKLRRARVAPAATVHQFVLHKADGSTVAFVEGQDDKEFLQQELRARLGKDARFVICDGKHGVLEALAAIEARFPETQLALFFVDKDFDDFIPVERPCSNRLFTTEAYSIENYLASETSLRVILCELAHFPHDDARVHEIIERYHSLVKSLCVVLRRFTACAICAKRLGIPVNLNNVRLGDVITIDDDCKIKKGQNLAAGLKKMAGVPENAVPVAAIRAEMRRLHPRISYKTWLRGKFDLWLFVRFVSAVFDALRGEPTLGTRTFRGDLQITVANLFRMLPGRLPCPKDLDSFLAREIPS